jgi:lysophospholipase L1-like esterase
MALALMTCLLVAACASAPQTPNPPASALPRQAGCGAATTADSLCILILGDSIAAGVPIAGDGRWWPHLRSLLASALPRRTIAIDSWAVPGSQVAVLESAASDQPDVGTYDLAIVIEGVNDAHVLSAESWRRRYAAAIAELEEKGLIVVVGVPPPSFENGDFGTRFDAIAAAVRVVSATGRPLLDIAARWRADGAARAGSYYADAIHQSAAGQDLMATMARDVVLEAIGVR